MTEWHTVARVGQLRPGDVVAIAIGAPGDEPGDELELVLGRDGDQYFAVQRRCLHQGGDLADGIVARGHVVCPQHGWRFSTATGRHDAASEYCLVRYAVRVVDDRIEVHPQPLPRSNA